jgi:hypothetical protein
MASGTRSRRSCNRFAASSVVKKLMPFALPLGRARLVTRPSLTGSSLAENTIGIVVVAALSASAERAFPAAITATCRRTRSAASAARRSTIRPAEQDGYILALDKAIFFEALPKLAQAIRDRFRRQAVKEPDHRHRRCCACAATGHAATAPPNRLTNSRRAGGLIVLKGFRPLHPTGPCNHPGGGRVGKYKVLDPGARRRLTYAIIEQNIRE